MPPTKIVQFCPKWYLNKYFYQSALSWGEKCKYVAQELCLFVQKRQFTDFCTVNTWTRHQRSLSTFTFNFLELSSDTYYDSSFFNRPYFVPIITKEPVWFSSILFYCQLASYRWRTFVNSVNYKTLRTICQNHDIPPSFLLLKYDHEWRSISKKKSWRTWNSTFLDGGCDFSKSSIYLELVNWWWWVRCSRDNLQVEISELYMKINGAR